MGVSVTIQSNSKQVQEQLRNLATREIHFAAARAVTQTATMTRDGQLFQEYNRFFTVRNKQFFKLVHGVAAADIGSTKRTGVAVAAISPRDEPRPAGTTKGRSAPKKLDTSFMKRHVKGGNKRSARGGKVTVPISNSPIKRLRSGSISKTYKPKNVMQKNGFIQTTKKGNTVMFRRMARGKIQPLYFLTPSVQIKGGYNPLRAARKGVKRWFEPSFNKFLRTVIVKTIERRGLAASMRR